MIIWDTEKKEIQKISKNLSNVTDGCILLTVFIIIIVVVVVVVVVTVILNY